jgi:hypothetical protein
MVSVNHFASFASLTSFCLALQFIIPYIRAESRFFCAFPDFYRIRPVGIGVVGFEKLYSRLLKRLRGEARIHRDRVRET